MRHIRHEVKPGQIWADNDGRSKGRTLKVIEVHQRSEVSSYAVCEVVTNDDLTQARLDGTATTALLDGYRPKDRRGSRTKILLKRFVPTSTGYRLVSGPGAPE